MEPKTRKRAAAETTADQSLALWKEYRRSGNRSLRNRLVLTYVPLVKHVVYKKLRELPVSCEADELISCGIEGLIAALDQYDPEKGAGLEPYLWTRIHGAVLDELRRRDWAPRSLRRRPRPPSHPPGARRPGLAHAGAAARARAGDRELRPHLAQLARGRRRR